MIHLSVKLPTVSKMNHHFCVDVCVSRERIIGSSFSVFFLRFNCEPLLKIAIKSPLGPSPNSENPPTYFRVVGLVAHAVSSYRRKANAELLAELALSVKHGLFEQSPCSERTWIFVFK